MRYDHVHGLWPAYDDLWVPWYSGAVHCSVWFGFVEGCKCFFIEPHSADRFFERGHFYGSADDVERFAFFSKAALEFMLKSGKRPQVIHCHDWQTALVPVLLFEIYQHIGLWDQRVCYTVHNFSHQGVCGEPVLWATGLCSPERFYDYNRLRDNFNPSAINLMKGGIVYSNFVTTVSPQHAWEVRHTDQGMGLGHTLHVHRGKFGGILNGVDYQVWNPETDGVIPSRYGPDWLDDKYANKQALRDRFWLRQRQQAHRRLHRPSGPPEGRAPDRSLDLLCARPGRPIRADRAEPRSRDRRPLLAPQEALNEDQDCHPELGFSVELAHLTYARADLLLMPQHVRAVWAGADDRAQVSDGADRARDRGAGRHGVRPRLLLARP